MIQNEKIHLKVGVALIDEKMRQLFEMVYSCLEESDQWIRGKTWVDLSCGKGKRSSKTKNNINISNEKWYVN